MTVRCVIFEQSNDRGQREGLRYQVGTRPVTFEKSTVLVESSFLRAALGARDGRRTHAVRRPHHTGPLRSARDVSDSLAASCWRCVFERSGPLRYSY